MRVCILLALLGVALLLSLPAHSAPARSAESELLTSKPLPQAPEVKPVEVGTEIRTGAQERRRVVLPDRSVLFVAPQTRAKVTGTREVALEAGELFVQVAEQQEPLSVKTPHRTPQTKRGSFSARVEKDGTRLLVTGGRITTGELTLAAGQLLAAQDDKPRPAPRAAQQLAWTRDLMSAADPALLPPNPNAGGNLVALDPDGQEAKLSLRGFSIDVHIEDGFARTVIDQTFFNQTASRLEGTFYFPLPPDASLSYL